MPSYKSNAKPVLSSLINKLKGIQQNVVEKQVRAIAIDLVSSNMSRIHNDGKAVDGSDIGDYADGAYKKKREERQKRTDKVNLDYTGKLSKEFSLAAFSKSQIGVGFLTEYGSNLQEILEEKYGKTIWGVTQEDEMIAEASVRNAIDKWLKNTK